MTYKSSPSIDERHGEVQCKIAVQREGYLKIRLNL